jgi:hypothetical protein
LTKENIFPSEEIKKIGVVSKNSTGKYNKELLLSSEKIGQSNVLKVASEKEKNVNAGVFWKEVNSFKFNAGCGCSMKYASKTTKTGG